MKSKWLAKKHIKLRVCYFAAAALIIIAEVFIALYVNDNFVRPYLGDVLAVIAVYCFVRIFIPVKCRLLPFWVFLFAVCVELVQYADFLTLLGLDSNRFLKILCGSVFDIHDIFCYAAGCAVSQTRVEQNKV